MENNMNIVVDRNNLKQHANRSITGNIWFEFGSITFPEKGWNDFIVIILTWWLKTSKDLCLSHNKTFELSFMDGPFVVSCLSRDDNNVVLKALDRRNGEEVVTNAVIKKKLLNNLIVEAVDIVLTTSAMNNWDSDDLRELKKNREGA